MARGMFYFSSGQVCKSARFAPRDWQPVRGTSSARILNPFSMPKRSHDQCGVAMDLLLESITGTGSVTQVQEA
ncbi:uncharacterized protein PgNI_08554 [Pyricularia grisea]|uniref:Uncharacterized protein n=1 Tax=Pyricularia grisea TaxID=148305 RepID=A0A6P8AUS0_PYRGI|nr:uncharacterized protein PgNI_08554 [Pyricularia grisea]TLD05971.1 hypothetical protein PgNI_08554 [Pyricularia grisea]